MRNVWVSNIAPIADMGLEEEAKHETVNIAGCAIMHSNFFTEGKCIPESVFEVVLYPTLSAGRLNMFQFEKDL